MKWRCRQMLERISSGSSPVVNVRMRTDSALAERKVDREISPRYEAAVREDILSSVPVHSSVCEGTSWFSHRTRRARKIKAASHAPGRGRLPFISVTVQGMFSAEELFRSGRSITSSPAAGSRAFLALLRGFFTALFSAFLRGLIPFLLITVR